MLKKVSVKEGDIKVGQRLPWPVYDADETLLMKENSLISSERQLEVLMHKGLYRGRTKREIELEEKERTIRSKVNTKPKTIFFKNIFKVKHNCAKQTKELLTCLVTKRGIDVVDTTTSICDQISRACKDDANASLAAVHLSKDFSYSVLHPLHTAILCEILIRRLSFKVEQERAVIAAALTMNVGMYELQEQLFEQSTPLTNQQKKEIFQHPAKSVDILQEAEVKDKNWLAIVSQHHERINGLGYPDKLQDKEIHQGAKIVALADIYAAMITPRAYRKPMAAQEALRDIFAKRGKDVDDALTQMLIKEVGIYPPGSFVKLNNGETGLVIKRAVVNNKGVATKPAVCSIFSPRGGRYERFSMRDTSDERYSIVSIAQPDLEDPINYPKLWGFND